MVYDLHLECYYLYNRHILAYQVNIKHFCPKLHLTWSIHSGARTIRMKQGLVYFEQIQTYEKGKRQLISSKSLCLTWSNDSDFIINCWLTQVDAGLQPYQQNC